MRTAHPAIFPTILALMCLSAAACLPKQMTSANPAAALALPGEEEDPDSVVVDAAAEAVIPESVAGEDDSQVVVDSAQVQSEREAAEEFLAQGHSHKRDASMEDWVSEYGFPIVINDQVRHWIEYFTTRGRPWMQKWLERSGRYEVMMRAELESHDVPGDLIYLAMIESGFSTRAYSRARAVGPWQFMSSTGRSYGLVSDWWMDTRRDPAMSTDAAARHLHDLYETFGDWYLAAAAYNAGAGKIRRAIARYETRDFFELAAAGRYLRSETRNYVPKLIAAALIAKHPRHFDFHDIVYQPPLRYDVVSVPDATGLDVIARAAGVSVAEVEVLNPALRRFCTPPGRAWDVRLPVGTTERFKKAFAKIPVKSRVTFRRHVVRAGDTLGQISRRYRTSTRAIMSMNGVRNPRVLRAGSTLVIPIPASRAPEVRVVRTRKLPRLKATRVASKVSAAPRAPVGEKRIHELKTGETLWGVSQLYGVRVRDLKRWNRIRNHRGLQAGRKLTVYVTKGARITGPKVATASKALPGNGAMQYYTVGSGDTVWGIARTHGVEPVEILKANQLSRRARIHPGDVLKIPQP